LPAKQNDLKIFENIMNFFSRHKSQIIFCVAVVFLIVFLGFLPMFLRGHFVRTSAERSAADVASALQASTSDSVPLPNYVSTPEPLKGIYMTSWTASSAKYRDPLVKLISNTELNALVIDIKDYSGKIVFPVTDPKLKTYGSEDVRVSDMRAFIDSLHQKGIYVIGRIAVFQDAYFVKYRPDLAVKNLSCTAIWKDRKGISWIDPGSREYWDYIVLLSRQARAIGFDEVNFDYIRFPSDGNMKDISYPFSSTTPKATVLKNFFSYLREKLNEDDGTPAGGSGRLKISADLFGMTTTAQDDMGIGQLLENALPYFDFVCPMVYPSHYPPTFMGYKNPEQYPYNVVQYAMQSAVTREKMLASSTNALSSTTGAVSKLASLRPWLQDFGLTVVYGAPEVRAQIKATNDVGLSSWLLWSASNKYTAGALDDK
jgi:hypothetical protein